MSGLLVARRGSLHRSRAAALDYAAEVAADNPFAWWRMEETSGSTVADEVGTNDGTVFGADLNVAGLGGTGSAASFDGTDDRVEVAHAATLNAGDLFTFECLLKVGNATAEALQIAADKTAVAKANGQYFLGWDNRTALGVENRLAFQCGEGEGTNVADYRDVAARTAVEVGAHVVGTFDRAASVSVRLWLNGTEVAGSSSGTVTVNSSNTLPLGIGMRPVSNDFPFGGVIDEVAMYDKVLPSARILAHAQAGGFA